MAAKVEAFVRAKIFSYEQTRAGITKARRRMISSWTCANWRMAFGKHLIDHAGVGFMLAKKLRRD